MRPWMVGLLLSGGCARAVADDQPCFEAQTAIAARYEECTGDTDAALALHDQVGVETECRWPDAPAFEGQEGELAAGVYECAFAIRNLPCELVEAYGTDIDAWLTAAPVCPLLLGPA